MEVYFDNSATTRVFDQVKDIMIKTMTEDFGNPSAKHKKGMEAERYIKEAQEAVAKTLKVNPKEIIFTSGGTESNNMALIGTALAKKRAGNHIISTGIEHASVYNPLAFLEEQGFRVTYLPVDREGLVDPQALKAAICPETILVSVMYVNNEIGAVEPVEELGRIIKETKPDVLFHVDAIQAYGKYVIRPKKMGIDMLSASGHKFHGPKGVGFLYLNENAKVRPILYGGEQQRGMRSGTENVPGIAGLGVAASLIYENHQEKVDYLYHLKEYFSAKVSAIEGVSLNGRPGRDSAPQIVSVSFAGVRSEVLLHALEDRGIYVSSGSACSSNHPGVSGTLKGIGLKKELLDATIRFSFSIFNTEAEVDYCIQNLEELLPMLRRYRRT